MYTNLLLLGAVIAAPIILFVGYMVDGILQSALAVGAMMLVFVFEWILERVLPVDHDKSNTEPEPEP